MIRSIWRYSHFALAVSSSLFILLATLTGLVLAFEPLDTNLQPYKAADSAALSLAAVIDTLTSVYDEVLELEVDANGFVKTAVISMEEDLGGDFYIDPHNGRKIGDIPDKRPIFEFTTNLHRSLFLKTPGRIFVGLTSFFLFLIAITGFLLFLKRQKGLRHFFDKVIKEDSAQYYHVISGRWMLIPIIIIAATGVYLSLWRFTLIPTANPDLVVHTEKLSESPALAKSDFPIFRETQLREFRKLEFPFSPDVEDFFILGLKDRQLKINQITGEIIEEVRYPVATQLSTLSFNLHTGNGSIIWSIILGLACINILYFMYSGAVISLKRIKSKLRNKYKAAEAEIVILVGSENGSTQSFGKLLQKTLLELKQKVFIDELNNYQSYASMKNLVVMTSTYGEGDPPINATRFLQLFDAALPKEQTNYSVVGFGSLAYPNYCQYALDVDERLKRHEICTPLQKPFLIHNKSYTSFKKWAEKWGSQVGIPLEIPPMVQQKKGKSHTFTLSEKQTVKDAYDESFILRLQSPTSQFRSGDLLAITPPEDPVERLYSIAKLPDNSILLSIKRHEFGLCSNYLNKLSVNGQVEGRIDRNKHFHFPSKAPYVAMIGNGTGMAPFLGMIQAGKSKATIRLYWGGRTQRSYQLYQKWIDLALEQDVLQCAKIALSKEDSPYHYVQDIIRQDAKSLVDQLAQGGVIMICGSVAMQNGVLEVLQEASLEHQGIHLSLYQQKQQILMDCY
ncbi:MAG: PepSY domain-containing protein [Saprospiraceae bacterium]|nr:PepSY domain-containing protein [Saprospiraceae bacterium]